MPVPASVYRPCDRLYLLALTPPLDGFDRFIGIWFYEGPPRVLVDVGPSSTASQVVAALEQIGIDLPPSKICYSHFGLRENARGRLAQHRDQLLRWQAIVADEVPRHPPGQARIPCLQRLLREDPLLHAFHQLPSGARHRELGFLENSLRGFIAALEEDQPAG